MERERCKITTFTEKRVNEKASERVRLTEKTSCEMKKEKGEKDRKTLPAPRLNSNPMDSGCTATDSKNLSQDRTISVEQNKSTRVRTPPSSHRRVAAESTSFVGIEKRGRRRQTTESGF